MKKKILSLLTLVFSLGIIFSLNTKEVKAVALRLEHPSNVYYSRYGGGGPYASNPFTIYYLDGHLGYCIEPGKEIYSYEYKGNLGMTNSPFSNQTNKLIQLIGHYGYEYPGHNTLRYRLATQALIWEKVSGQTVRYYTERYDEGQEIVVTPEKNEIMRLVNSHTLKASFDDTVAVAEVGEEVILTDNNNVLSMFSVTSDGGNIVKIDGNKLHITPTKAGTTTITLAKAKYDNVSTMLFSPNDGRSQKMAILRSSDEVTMKISVFAIAKGGKLKVQKVDNDTGEVIKLAGIKFKLKDLSTNKYICENDSCTYETDKDGSFKTNTYLFGDYELEEVDSKIDGYLWNSSKLKIHIDDDTKVGSDDMIEIKFSNKRVKGKLTINKTGENVVIQKNGDYTLQELPLSNVKFGLYANDNIYSNGVLIYKAGTLVKILATDSKGEVEVSNLYLGKYYLVEVDAPKGYIIDSNKYEIDFTYKDQYTEIITKKLTFKNSLMKGSLKITKEGEMVEDGTLKNKKLSNIKFGLYASDDIYLNSTLVYKKDSLIKTLVTNESGEASLNNLILGKYYLKELETNKGYILDNQKYEFEITNDNYKVTKTYNLKNSLMKGSLEITKEGESINKGGTLENIKLSNIKFGLYASDDIYLNETLVYKKDSLIKTLTTDTNGKTGIKDLILGKYYLKELETNKGYILDNQKYEFEITSDNYKVTKTYNLKNNLMKGSFEITKEGETINEDGNYETIKLSNIKFGLYASDDIYLNGTLVYKKDSLIKTLVTNESGEASLNNLILGKYYLKELETNKGYILDNQKYEFEITSDNYKVTKTYNLKNYLEKGSLVIDKLGEKLVIDDGDYHYEKVKLPNIKFGLYAREDIYLNDTLVYKKDSLIKTIVTDINGHAEINDLCLGSYYLIELKTDSNHVLETSKYEFKITKNKEMITFTIENKLKKGELEFLKIDSGNGEPIPDTLIEIYKEEQDEPILIYHGYTDINGQIKLTDLPLGKYMLIEVESSKGYVLSNETFYFDLEDDKDYQSITMKNDKFEEVEVPSTGMDMSFFLKLAGFACFLGGISMIIYSKKYLFNK